MRALLGLVVLLLVPSLALGFVEQDQTAARGGPLAHESGMGWGPLHATDVGPGGDAVDLFNGALWLQSTDAFVPGPRGLDLVLTRSYSSHRSRADSYLADFQYPEATGWLGRGWMLTAGFAWVRHHEQGGVRFFHGGYFTADGVEGARMLGSSYGPDDSVVTWDPSWAPGATSSLLLPALPGDLYGQDPSQPEVGLLEDGSFVYFTPTGLGVLTRDGLAYLLEQVSVDVSVPFPLGDGQASETAYHVTSIHNRFGDAVTFTYGAGEQLVSADASWTPASPDVTLQTSNGVLQSITVPGPVAPLTRTYVVDELLVPDVVPSPATAPSCDCADAPPAATVTPVLVEVTEPDGLTTAYGYTATPLAGVEAIGRVYPSPSAPQAAPMQFAALTTITAPSGLISSFAYAPETWLRDADSSCCSTDGYAPFAWRSRLAVVERSVDIDGQVLSWTFDRPGTPADTDVPVDLCTSCGLSIRPDTWLPVAQPDPERVIVTTDPYGITSTYTFAQRSADWLSGDQSSSMAACAVTNTSTCGTVSPALPAPRLLSGQLLGVAHAEGGADFYEEELVWALWQPTTFANAVPVLQVRSQFQDGAVGADLIESWPAPDAWGRVGDSYIQVSAPEGPEVHTTTATFIEPTVELLAWNLVDLPTDEQSFLNGVPTRDVTWTWATSGPDLGRLLNKTAFPSVAGGPDLETAWTYSDDLLDGTTTITTYPPAGTAPSVTTVVGPSGVLSEEIGGDTLFTAVFGPNGSPLSRVDERSTTETWTWDPATGQPLQHQVLAGAQLLEQTSWSWAGWPQMLETTDQGGNASWMQFDAVGRPLEAWSPANDSPLGTAPGVTTQSWSYDDVLRTVTSIGPWGFQGPHERTTSFDARGRPIDAASANPQVGDATATYPSATEQTVTRTVGGARDVSTLTAADGSVRGVTDLANQDCAWWTPTTGNATPGPGGPQVGSFLRRGACGPNEVGERTVADVADASGGVVASADTGRGDQEVVRDGAGRVEQVLASDGTLNLGYEAARGRIETMQAEDSYVDVTWGDAGGATDRPVEIATESGSASLTYADGGLLESVTWDEDYADLEVFLTPPDLVASGTVSYDLDGEGRVAALIYADGSRAEFTYDSFDRSQGISYRPMEDGVLGAAQPLVSATSYSHWGDVHARSWANGMDEDWVFDGLGRPMALEVTNLPAAVDAGSRSGSSYSEELTWDAHQLASVETTPPDSGSETVLYGYDARDRPVSATGGSESWTWGWSNVDDLVSRDTGGAVESLEISGLRWFGNRPADPGAGYSLDPDRGVLTGAAGYSFTFDPWGRAISASGAPAILAARDPSPTDGVELRLAYNALGRLALEVRDDSGEARWYRYGPAGELLERWVWVPDAASTPWVGDWQLEVRFIHDPTTGGVVGAWVDPAGRRAAPACPESVEVGTTGSDHVEVAWSPVLGAAAYEIRRDGVPWRYVGADELSFRDFEITSWTDYTYAVVPLSASGAAAEGCAEQPVAFEDASAEITWNPNPLAAGWMVEGCLADGWNPATEQCDEAWPLSSTSNVLPQEQTSWTFDYEAGEHWYVQVTSVDGSGNLADPQEPIDLWATANGSSAPTLNGAEPVLVVKLSSATGRDTIIAGADPTLPLYYGRSRVGPDGSLLEGSGWSELWDWSPGDVRTVALAPNLVMGPEGPWDPTVAQPINWWAFGKSFAKSFVVGATIGGALTAVSRLFPPVGWAVGGGLLLYSAINAARYRLAQAKALGGVPTWRLAKVIALDAIGVGEALEVFRGFDLLTGLPLPSNERSTRLGGLLGGFAGGAVGVRLGSRVRRCRTPCFVAGTLVMTATGLVAIEDLEPGDTVLARAEYGDEVGWREVLATHATENRDLVELAIESADGVEVFVTTPEHPFATPDGEWLPAGELAPGEVLVGVDGELLTLVSSTWRQDRATVFNLEVEEFHTYFVGETGVLVHNGGGDPCEPGSLRWLGPFKERVRALSFDPDRRRDNRLEAIAAAQLEVLLGRKIRRGESGADFVDEAVGGLGEISLKGPLPRRARSFSSGLLRSVENDLSLNSGADSLVVSLRGLSPIDAEMVRTGTRNALRTARYPKTLVFLD